MSAVTIPATPPAIAAATAASTSRVRGPVVAAVALTFAVLLCAAPAAAQQYRQSDAALVEAAKKEGTLTVYSSLPQPDNVAIGDAFTKKYGVKVVFWRGSSEALLQRAVNEAKAGRRDADLAVASASAIEPLYREQLLQPLDSPVLGDLYPQAVAAHRHHAAIYFNVFVQAYNTTLVKAADLPKSFADLTAAKWNGKLAVETEDFDWFAEAVKSMGEEKGLATFREIATKNGISVRTGHTLLTNLVVAGEVPFALTVYNYSAAQTKAQGAPIDYLAIKPAIARPVSVGMLKDAPHPNATRLFIEYALGEGQKTFVDRYFVATNKAAPSEIDRESLVVIDNAVMLDQAKMWQERYEAFKAAR